MMRMVTTISMTGDTLKKFTLAKNRFLGTLSDKGLAPQMTNERFLCVLLDAFAEKK